MFHTGVRTGVSYRESDSAFVTVTVEDWDEQLMDAERVQNATGLMNLMAPDSCADARSTASLSLTSYISRS